MPSPDQPGEPPGPVAGPTPKRRKGLSLRVMLGLMVVVAVGLGIWANEVRQNKAAITMVRQHHGMYYHEFEYDENYTFVDRPKSWATRWLRDLVGDENLHDVTYLRIVDPTFNDADFAVIARRFPKLRSLGIDGSAITDRSLGLLRGNQHLCGFFVKSPRITDAGIDLLGLETLPRVSLIDIRGTQISDSKAIELEKLMEAREAALKRAKTGKRVDSHVVFKGRFFPQLETTDVRGKYERELEAKLSK